MLFAVGFFPLSVKRKALPDASSAKISETQLRKAQRARYTLPVVKGEGAAPPPHRG